MLAGPRGLNGGVEGQQVGLLGAVIDGLDDGADLLAQLAQILDLCDCPGQGCATTASGLEAG
jgi:hypothetical protein